MTDAVPAEQLRAQLTDALERLYMGPNSFLHVFQETPEVALAAFKSDPNVFGRLRSYVGAISLEANRARVASLARQLHRALAAAHNR